MTVAPSTRLPDYSEYLVGERLAREEAAWAEVRHYERNARIVMDAARLFGLGAAFSLVELCCGSGWVPTRLSTIVRYCGIDKNPEALELARAKNVQVNRYFVERDIRDVEGPSYYDLVCSFAALKHFGLYEWETVFRRMLRVAPYGVFDLQVTHDGTASYDDGTDYHHTWMSRVVIDRCIAAEGRSTAAIEHIWDGEAGLAQAFYVRPAEAS